MHIFLDFKYKYLLCSVAYKIVFFQIIEICDTYELNFLEIFWTLRTSYNLCTSFSLENLLDKQISYLLLEEKLLWRFQSDKFNSSIELIELLHVIWFKTTLQLVESSCFSIGQRLGALINSSSIIRRICTWSLVESIKNWIQHFSWRRDFDF